MAAGKVSYAVALKESAPEETFKIVVRYFGPALWIDNTVSAVYSKATGKFSLSFSSDFDPVVVKSSRRCVKDIVNLICNCDIDTQNVKIKCESGLKELSNDFLDFTFDKLNGDYTIEIEY